MKDRGMAYYLEDLNRVRELSFEKLGEWKEKYPYSQMVHFLMAKKHQLEGLVDDMNVFHTASFYSVDREHLYNRMSHSECESAEEAEWISREAMNIGPEELRSSDELLAADTDIVLESNESYTEAIETESEIEQPSEEIEAHQKEEAETKPSESMNSNDKEEVELSPFANWLESLAPVSTENPLANQKTKVKKSKQKKSKKKKGKKTVLEAKIKKSVIKEDEIVSEPLAKILADQGHTDKAIKMYKKLSLIFPEKSSFFASQIEKINNSK